MQSIGIDIGTTSICGARIDLATGQVARTLTINSSADLQSSFSYEKIQDPTVILSIVTQVLEDLLCEDVAAIGLSGQMHGMLYLDKNGKPLSPLYTWQDARGDLPFEGGTYATIFGAPSGYGLTTHYYNVQNNLVPEGMASFCTIADFIALSLCGITKPLLHVSNAASLGKFDIKAGQFSVDVPFDFTAEYSVAGQYKGIPVSIAIGDNQAGFFGSCKGDGSLLVNVGTGSQVSFLSNTFPDSNTIEVRPCNEGKNLLAGCALCGGRAFVAVERFFCDVAELASGVRPDKLYKQMDALLAKDFTSADTMDLHYATSLRMDTRLCGTRQEASLTGSIQNLTLENFTPVDFMLASLQGITDELYNFYIEMGVKATKLIGSGNGIRNNPALQKIVSRTFGLPLYIPVHKEEAAVGAALFALCSAGVYKNMDEAQALLTYKQV